MKFVKKHVPDKRRNDNKRPIVVNGNPVLWIAWKLAVIIKNSMNSIKLLLERSFIEIHDLKEEVHNGQEE